MPVLMRASAFRPALLSAALALAVGVAYPVLDWAGLDAGGDNTAFALTTLALLYGGLPVLIKLAAIGLMWRFPLAESDQRAARQQIMQAV